SAQRNAQQGSDRLANDRPGHHSEHRARGRVLMVTRAGSRMARGLVALGLSGAACLPTDTRPPPGSVMVPISSDGGAASGIPASETLDGWSISFDRVLVVLGAVGLD